jgi:hypothetical protein
MIPRKARARTLPVFPIASNGGGSGINSVAIRAVAVNGTIATGLLLKLPIPAIYRRLSLRIAANNALEWLTNAYF